MRNLSPSVCHLWDSHCAWTLKEFSLRSLHATQRRAFRNGRISNFSIWWPPKVWIIFCSRVHVNVFFLDWCISPCGMIKQRAYYCGICSAWKCCAKMDNIPTAYIFWEGHCAKRTYSWCEWLWLWFAAQAPQQACVGWIQTLRGKVTWQKWCLLRIKFVGLQIA